MLLAAGGSTASSLIADAGLGAVAVVCASVIPDMAVERVRMVARFCRLARQVFLKSAGESADLFPDFPVGFATSSHQSTVWAMSRWASVVRREDDFSRFTWIMETLVIEVEVSDHSILLRHFQRHDQRH